MRLFMYIAAAFLATLLAFLPPAAGQEEEALIDTGTGPYGLGKIQGSVAWTSASWGQTGRKYYWFTGLPYAKPESYTGANRFRIPDLWDGPLPDETGDGTFKANGSKSIIHCPQKPVVDLGIGSNNKTLDVSAVRPMELIKSYYSREGKTRRRDISTQHWGTEECLIVTVSTPSLPKGEPDDKLLPVIYFIHGGSFDAFWGSVFGGQRLLNQDVILVSMNYRLGLLGTINLGVEEAPGNAQVYDCIKGLEWIEKYIHHFGGDKTRVTVTGQSAGAVLATTVFLSPLSKGLISGVIGDSGSALSVWANQKNPIMENLKVVRKSVRCRQYAPPEGELPTDDQAKAIVDCMKKLGIEDLLAVKEAYEAEEQVNARMGYDAFVPSVQKASLADLGIKLALSETPAEILKNKRQNDVPLMMGVTRHDGSFVFDTTFNDYLVANGLDSDTYYIRNYLMPKFLKGVGVEDPTGAMLHYFQKAYLGDTANSDDILSKFPGLIDIHTVLGFKAGGYGLVEAHAKLNPKSYYYAFDYKGMFTTYDIAFGSTLVPGGVAHVDDLLYLFQLIPLMSDQDWSVSDRYVKYWANFATYGNPNGAGDLDEPFPRFNEEDHRFLIINGTDSVGYHCRDTWIGNSLELFK